MYVASLTGFKETTIDTRSLVIAFSSIVGLKSVSIRRIQGFGYGVLEFLRSGGAKARYAGSSLMDNAAPLAVLIFTWMTFEGNTHDLGSFREEMDEITALHQSRRRKRVDSGEASFRRFNYPRDCDEKIETASQNLVTTSECPRDGVRDSGDVV
ncbi:hypothetical protein Tco_1431207 [Tanacetum coccineum]